MANAWFRMYSEFANDPKIQMLSEVMQRRFVMLLCIRCNNDVTLHDDELSFQLRVTLDEWALTKAEFIKRGFIDDANNIRNWDKRQFRSDSSRERVSRHRSNKKQECNVTVTPPDTDTDTDTDIKTSYEVKKPPNKKNVSTKGSRLPADWDLPEDWGNWAEAQGLKAEEIIFECDKFKDHFIARAGPHGIKLDWQATWRNWIRKYLENRKNEQLPRKTNYQSTRF